jgi:Ca2+-binding RTX toxin-like protein
MQSPFGRISSRDRSRKSRSRRPLDGIDGLERKDLLTGGTVVNAGSLVMIMPASSGLNSTIVSYQQHNGTTMLDVNLNGSSNYFSATQVTSVYYMGSSASGPQTFQDSTSLNVTAFGGSGTNLFEGGAGQDTFIGGSGSNTFDAGTGSDVLEGGYGTNVFNENTTGSGIIEELGRTDTINVPQAATGSYIMVEL